MVITRVGATRGLDPAPLSQVEPSDERTGRRQRCGVVGILALQGSFPLHQAALGRLDVETRLVTRPAHLEGLSGLILPGGESTVMSLLARRYDLFEPLQAFAREGKPVFGTCAGAILLGQGTGSPARLEAVPVQLERNAYGSQIDSFAAEVELRPFDAPFHAVFIRAPRITEVPTGPEVEILGEHDGDPIWLRVGNVLLSTFHPELTEDLRMHRYFVARFGDPDGRAQSKATTRRT